MYNNDKKQEFLRKHTSKPSVSSLGEMVFGWIEPYENEWQSDICTRSVEDVQKVLDKVLPLKTNGLYPMMWILREYAKWCIAEHVEGACDSILQIDKVGIPKMISQTVPSPLGLQKYLDVLYYPEDDLTTDNIYRCYYWLAYAGMEEKDIYDVTTDDVDLYAISVTCKRTGKSFSLCEESMKAMKNCKELDYFMFRNPNRENDELRHRVEGDLLLRGIRGNQNWKSFRVSLSRDAKKHEEDTGKRLSYSRVRISGMYYRIWYNEISLGISPVFYDIVKEYYPDTVAGLSIGRRNKIARDYENDYARWKLAWF